MPENQTAWNSDDQGIKEKIIQNNQTGKVADEWAASENRADVADFRQGWLLSLVGYSGGMT